MDKVYKAKIGSPFWLAVATSGIGISVIFYFINQHAMITPLSLLALAIPVIMLVWILISTRYFIRNDTLTYQSGFLKGQIPIRNIRSVKTNTTLWMGTKPSLARKGMIIKYNQFREVFISPAEPEALLTDLKRINPAIEIV